MKRFVLLALIAFAALSAQPYNHAVGVYPGAPGEDFAPALVPDGATYRNLAFHRPAYHSSSSDYNQTAQLITDGIKETSLPRGMTVTSSAAPAAPGVAGRGFPLAGGRGGVVAAGDHPWVEYEFTGGPGPMELDRVELAAGNGVGGRGGRGPAAAPVSPQATGGWSATALGSDDGQAWRELGRAAGDTPPGAQFRPSISLAAPASIRFLRINLEAPGVTAWRITDALFFDRNTRVYSDGQKAFNSAWISKDTQGEEWVYVDLGAPCSFDRVALYWLHRPAEGSLETSDDAAVWKTLQPLAAGTGPNDDIRLAQPATARYVRVLMTKPVASNYALTEMEVYGRGGFVAQPKPTPAPEPNGRIHLAGGAWRIQRDSLVSADGEEISKTGFQDKDWLLATVPATVLSSYLKIGALPDPNFGDNQLQISDSFFYADFWYRDEFTAPAADAGKRVWLNFDGINWKADVYLERPKAGTHRRRLHARPVRRHGAHSPGSQERAGRAHREERHAGQPSRRRPCRAPDRTAALLGADNPTYHAIRRLGLDPHHSRPRHRHLGGRVSDHQRAGDDRGSAGDDQAAAAGSPPARTSPVEATLRNHATAAVSRRAARTLRNGGLRNAGHHRRGRRDDREARSVHHPALHLATPSCGGPPDTAIRICIRVELTFVTADRRIIGRENVPGRRAPVHLQRGRQPCASGSTAGASFARGGNWGFPESILRYRAREYDAAVRYHKDMNFTMIRNWVGQTGDDAFYDACDKYGIVVWQDFWLANPVDGPNPDDNDLFLRNARDYMLRIRNHPSIGLYCGRNEGIPPKPIDDGLRQLDRGPASRICTTSPAPPTIISGNRVRGERPRTVPRPAHQELFRGARHAQAPQRDGHAQRAHHRQREDDDAGIATSGRRTWTGGCTISPMAGAQAGASFSSIIDKQLRRGEERGGVGDAGAVRQLRRLPRHVRSAEQEPHGAADLDEPSGLALLRVADLRLLLRADRRLLRREEGLRAAAYPVERSHGQRGGGELQRGQ